MVGFHILPTVVLVVPDMHSVRAFELIDVQFLSHFGRNIAALLPCMLTL